MTKRLASPTVMLFAPVDNKEKNSELFIPSKIEEISLVGRFLNFLIPFSLAFGAKHELCNCEALGILPPGQKHISAKSWEINIDILSVWSNMTIPSDIALFSLEALHEIYVHLGTASRYRGPLSVYMNLRIPGNLK